MSWEQTLANIDNMELSIGICAAQEVVKLFHWDRYLILDLQLSQQMFYIIERPVAMYLHDNETHRHVWYDMSCNVVTPWQVRLCEWYEQKGAHIQTYTYT